MAEPQLRSEMNIELNHPPNLERLVLGCIDADFCKQNLLVSSFFITLGLSIVKIDPPTIVKIDYPTDQNAHFPLQN